MKVLLVSQYFWPETFGINALSLAFAERGVELTVLTGKPNYPDGEVFAGHSAWGCRREDWRGIEVVRVPLFPRGRKSGWRLALNYLSFVAAGLSFGPWLLRGRRFDAVFVYAPSPILQTLPAIFLARQKRAPLALWVQDLWPESLAATGFVRNGKVLALVARVVRFIYRHTDRLLVPSEGFRAPIAALTDDARKIRYYPNAWVDETGPAAADAPVAALAEKIAAGFSVVFAGNLGTAQALHTVIDAAERLQREGSSVRFFLIGSGSVSGWLATEVARRGLTNVELPGRFPPAAMPHCYAAASALLVSLRDEPIFAQTIPSKVQGYLAAGRPVIAALNGEGARVVVEAGAGLACPAGDAAALAAAVARLAALDADARRKMGENARRYAFEHFSLDRLADDLAAQLAELAATHRRKMT
ncbi:MAG: glycosyltransferase [bacterium]|nr:MAG: glycosyltransferase [bacterium]KAF0147157.1 MAG: glycosyltransferase [bacterium]KAF0165722.1 MAG: glycosyltransferase [bacterium]